MQLTTTWREEDRGKLPVARPRYGPVCSSQLVRPDTCRLTERPGRGQHGGLHVKPGRSRSSHAGSHQLARPSMCITDGTRTVRAM